MSLNTGPGDKFRKPKSSQSRDPLEEFLMAQFGELDHFASAYRVGSKNIRSEFVRLGRQVFSGADASRSETNLGMTLFARAYPLLVRVGEDQHAILSRFRREPGSLEYTAALSGFIAEVMPQVIVDVIEQPKSSLTDLVFYATTLQAGPVLFRDYIEFLNGGAEPWQLVGEFHASNAQFDPREGLLGLIGLRCPVPILRLLGNELIGQMQPNYKQMVDQFLSALSSGQVGYLDLFKVLPKEFVEPQMHALRILAREGEDVEADSFYDPVGPPFPFDTEPGRDNWNYLAQRLEMAGSKRPQRDKWIVRELGAFLLQVATKRFSAQEGQHFLTIAYGPADKDDEAAAEKFYRESYRIDQHPAGLNTREHEALREQTYRAVRGALQAQTALNVLKGYTQTTDQGDWLLERIAKSSGGSAKVIRSKDIGKWPGSGCVISGLDPAAFLDLSTEHSRSSFHRAHPWIRRSGELLTETSFFAFRGFFSWMRTAALKEAKPGVAKSWAPIRINCEPYAPIAWSDHFHAWNPETRVMLVPEAALCELLRQLEKRGVDPSSTNVTPQALHELSMAYGSPVLNVGTAAVLFAGLGSSWPFGSKPYWSWERGRFEDSQTPFRDTFHLHHSFRIPGRYTNTVTPQMRHFFEDLQEAGTQVAECLGVYSDILQCFLTAEAAWAKEYAHPDKEAARLAPPEKSSDVPGDGAEGKEKPGESGEQDDEMMGPALLPRTRILEEFIATRARTLRALHAKGITPRAEDFPRLEIQYSNMYQTVAGAPYISGRDLAINLPSGSKVYLFDADELAKGDLRIGERQEILWYEHFSRPSRYFKFNDAPRIVW